jgi:hypothetical protein
VASLAREMVKAVKTNFPLLLVFAILITALPLILPGGAQSSGSNFAVSTIIIYYLHRQVLFDLPMNLLGIGKPPEGVDMPKDSIGRFMLVSLLFTLVVAVPAGFAAYNWAIYAVGRIDKVNFIGMFVVAAIILLWLLLSAIGTALPAAASKLPFSLSRAWQAGRKTGLRVALQLFLFPGLTFITVVAFAILTDWVFDIGNSTTPVSFGIGVIFGALFMIPSVMTVVILVRVFKSAYLVE